MSPYLPHWSIQTFKILTLMAFHSVLAPYQLPDAILAFKSKFEIQFLQFHSVLATYLISIKLETTSISPIKCVDLTWNAPPASHH